MTAALAPELAAFRRALELFPEPQRTELGKMVFRLSALVGKMSSTYLVGVEPEGFDGVEQRGEYHRLLMSEWLLAEEAPEEFLRRAAMKEHLFLRLARKEPRGGRRLLVFFDSGPMQLGSPRLVHLGVLLALEHQATQAGADLQWAIIQNPDIEGTSIAESSILSLLGSRSSTLATNEGASGILSRYDAPQVGDSVWWVGDRTFIEENHLPGSTISISDDLLEQGDALSLRIVQHRKARTVSLPLPAAPIRTRLMRNPFERLKPQIAQDLSDVSFELSHCGRYVWLRAGGQVHLVSLSVAGPRRTFPLYSDGTKLVGIARNGKQVAQIHRHGGRYALTVRGKEWALHFQQRKPEPPLGDSFWQIFVVGKREKTLIIMDEGGRVFVGKEMDDAISLRPVLDECLKLVWRIGHVEFVRRMPDLHLEFGSLNLDGQIISRGRDESTQSAQLAVGYDPSSRSGAIAHAIPPTTSNLESGKVRPGFSTWSVRQLYSATITFQVRETLKVVGIKRCGRDWAPLVLSENRRELRIEGEHHSHVIASFHDPIERWEMAATRSTMVCQQGGGLCVVHFREDDSAETSFVSLPILREHGREMEAS